MADYNKSTNFAAKDTLPIGNPAKVVRGTEIDAEFSAISTAVNSKADTTATTASLALKADKATTVTAGTGLTGGGDLSTNRTISLATGGVATASIADSAVTAAKLASNSVTTAKIADASVTAAKLANGGNELGFRNRIINGDMRIDQRNNGASVSVSTPSSTWAVDRWQNQQTVGSKLTIQQNQGGVTPPIGFTNYHGSTTSSAYSVTASDFFLVSQAIEANNIADFGWGGSNAVPATLSFWARSSLTGVFGGSLENGTDRSFPFSFTINSANTWEYKTVAILAPTAGGAWGTGSGIGVFVRFSLGAGSTYSGTAGAWSSSRLFSATGATSVVGTNGATFYITGVQLEKGSTATPFDYRPYGTELALCQRYFQMSAGSTSSTTFPSTVGNTPGIAQCFGTEYAFCYGTFPVRMRATPSVTVANNAGTLGTVTIPGIGTAAVSGIEATAIGLIALSFPSGGSDQRVVSGQYTASAEL